MLQAPFFYKTTPESSLHVIAPPLELVVLALDPVPVAPVLDTGAWAH